MEPVPYEIEEHDIDEVLDAYEAPGGGAWSDQDRRSARDHVLKNVVELNDTIRSASEDPSDALGEAGDRMGDMSDRPGDRAPARRGMALAAIEDLLVRDGFIDVDAGEDRVFPVTGGGSEDSAEGDDAA
jgi:hypothetical protein